MGSLVTSESEPGTTGAFSVRTRSWLCWCCSYFYLPLFSDCGQVSASQAFEVGMSLLCEGAPVYLVLVTYSKLFTVRPANVILVLHRLCSASEAFLDYFCSENACQRVAALLFLSHQSIIHALSNRAVF